MSCGCIPIVTNIPSFAKIAEKGRYGRVFPVGDAQALASAARSVRADQRERLAREVQAHVRAALSFAAIYHDIVATRRDPRTETGVQYLVMIDRTRRMSPPTTSRTRSTRRGVAMVHRERNGLAIAFGFGLLALVFDQLCEHFKRTGRKRFEALSDGAAHIATGLAVSLPAAPFVEHKRRFVVLSALSAVTIDLDHVVAARSMKLIRCMTMPTRPASHSVLTVSAISYVAERFWPGTQSALAVTLGLGSHLLRDLATGGAPLFLPRRIIELTRPPVALMMFMLGFFGRWYARRQLDPSRPRRSNPVVLAPEVLVVGSRAIRAVRRHDRAA